MRITQVVLSFAAHRAAHKLLTASIAWTPTYSVYMQWCKGPWQLWSKPALPVCRKTERLIAQNKSYIVIDSTIFYAWSLQGYYGWYAYIRT